MIIKVVELLENDQYTEYDGGEIVKKQKRYCLVENFLNVSKIVSFREIDRGRYEKSKLPEGLLDEQQFTYISFSGPKKGIVVIDSPMSLQEKINCLSSAGPKQDILKG
tara:strand:+ start:13010 stop:13333 length:324 start_codon:yes stop_codon:yes gene_type:complete